MDNTQRFSGLADVYTAGRPAYADAFIESLYQKYGFLKDSVIADIGSGTGKFAKQLLDKGSFVYCVEPNEDMRNTAIAELGRYEKFQSINGSAADTGLKEKSVDYITTAQAFHWFDPALFRAECRRILKENGKVILIWNQRDMSSEINQRCTEIYAKYCPNFNGFAGGIRKDDARIQQFFEGKYEYIEFDNPLFYDKEKFINRCLSSSYSLKKGEEKYAEYIGALGELFDKYATGNMLMLPNKTVVYIGGMD